MPGKLSSIFQGFLVRYNGGLPLPYPKCRQKNEKTNAGKIEATGKTYLHAETNRNMHRLIYTNTNPHTHTHKHTHTYTHIHKHASIEI